MKADRLHALVQLLRTRGQVSAAELAALLAVSVRTVYRDVEALAASGVRVHTERGRRGGIRLLPGGEPPTAPGEEARGGERPGDRGGERVLVDPVRRPPDGGPEPVAGLGGLQYAVFADRRLRLRYRHGGAPASAEYTVDPYGLVSRAAVWYLVADVHGEPRLFRADRVLAAETTAAPVRRRPGQGLGEVWAGLRGQLERVPAEVPVRVRVRRTQLELFTRMHAARISGAPVAAGEEWVELALGFRSLAAVRTLLAFGADAEVLGPPAARRELARAAAEAVRLYAGDG
ncbi:helix-turn-helix transcriptional regulator [Kitasatospora sp. NPDC054939]